MNPQEVRLRAYAGEGTCLLVTLRYAEAMRPERHLLIDFGAGPGGQPVAERAAAVADHCGDLLDAVMLTRHHPAHTAGLADPDAFQSLSHLFPERLILPPGASGSDHEGVLAGWAQRAWVTHVRGAGPVDVATVLPGVRLQVLAPVDRWRAVNQIVAEPAGLGAAAVLTHALADIPLHGVAGAGTPHPAGRPGLTAILTIGSRVVLLGGTAAAEDWARLLHPNDSPTEQAVARLLRRVEVLVVALDELVAHSLDDVLNTWQGRSPPPRIIRTGGPIPGADRLEALTGAHRTAGLFPGARWFDLIAPTSSRGRFRYAVDSG